MQELHINNAQYAVLEASQDFMVTALILVSGIVTDRIGGAGGCIFVQRPIGGRNVTDCAGS